MSWVFNPFTGSLDYTSAASASTGDISGTGVIGRVAEFVTDTKTLQAANLIAPSANILTLTATAASTLALNITAGKTLTLTAADDYTLTIPATGTAALLGVANVFTAAQTVNVNSATAFIVEQDGVKDNVLVVDTTNGYTNLENTTRADPASSGSTQSQGLRLRLSAAGTNGVMDFGIATSGQGWIQTVLKSNLTTNQDLLLNLNGGAVLVGTKTNYGARFVAQVSTGVIAVFSSSNSLSATSGAGMVGIATPNPTATGQRLGFLVFGSAKGGTSFSTGARISGYADGAWTDGVSYPTYLSLETTASGGITPIERLRIGSTGLATFTLDSAATNSPVNIADYITTSSGTVANGFGVSLSFTSETATAGTNQQQGLISTSWVDATNATRKAKLSLSAYDTAARLGMEIQASGTESMIGFHGVSPIARAVLATGAGASVDDVITALQNLGLVKQS
jgi:hypothetical protein